MYEGAAIAWAAGPWLTGKTGALESGAASEIGPLREGAESIALT